MAANAFGQFLDDYSHAQSLCWDIRAAVNMYTTPDDPNWESKRAVMLRKHGIGSQFYKNYREINPSITARLAEEPGERKVTGTASRKGKAKAKREALLEVQEDTCTAAGRLESPVFGYIDLDGIAPHPLAFVNQDMEGRGWLTFKGRISLRPPFTTSTAFDTCALDFMNSVITLSGWDRHRAMQRFCERSAPAMTGHLKADVSLTPEALQYGTLPLDNPFVEFRAKKKHDMAAKVPLASSAAMRKLMNAILNRPSSLLEIDTTASYWSQSPNKFYTLPEEPRRIPQDAQALASNKTTRGRSGLKTGATVLLDPCNNSVAGMSEGDLRGDQDEEKLDSMMTSDQLPFNNSTKLLLEACRPASDHEEATPPAGSLNSTMLLYQRKALSWMLRRERPMTEDSEARTFPGWTALRAKVPESADQHQSKRVKAENNDEGAVSENSTGLPGKCGTFYFEEVTGMLSAKRFKAHPLQPGGLLADQMGLGKTVEILALIASNPRTPDYCDISSYREEIREACKQLQDLDIVLTTYEFLTSELRLCSRITFSQSTPRSCPLEVLWHRVVVDEAQMISHSTEKVAGICNELWRTNGWSSTGTPITQGVSDLHGLLVFLDHDPLASARHFKTLLEIPFEKADALGIYRMRSLLPRFMWRHTKDHVRDELDLPSNETIWLDLKMTGLEHTLYSKNVAEFRKKFVHAIRSGRTPDLTSVNSLRQLVSHPQHSDDFGSDARLSFLQLFDRLLERNERALRTRRAHICTLTLQLAFGVQFYSNLKGQKWDGGEPPSDDEMRRQQKSAKKPKQMLRIKNRKRRWNMPRTLDGNPDPPMHFNPERQTLLFYEKIYRDASEADLENPEFHLVDRDAGSEEVGPAANGFIFDNAVVMRNRLRGGATGRREQIGWILKPRAKMDRLKNELVTQHEQLDATTRDVRYLRNRPREEASSASTKGNGTARCVERLAGRKEPVCPNCRMPFKKATFVQRFLPMRSAQAMARISRIRQTRSQSQNTTTIRVRMKNTIEEEIVEIASRKTKQTDVATGGKYRDGLTLDDLAKILGVNIVKEREEARLHRVQRRAEVQAARETAWGRFQAAINRN
ncbi:hypothetical protein K437DRAFT_281506 [Tilletiaria anomala UBC 951]|uniref:SNF2 N-terminal domain-containing protein n=1 Tax=Tilletiaria anomala (strain ATCC 24038 / CBS 436.72 / UBC 951) TaxID=1037660 RepID=A0A066WEH2_TILAU|nr:uncharacterized protein K437DRAFT_281506 [Tilletiaria anomala UBC 951]KDN52171.1 hypothetical protein K437DRAFT_281506 [Tilletiaria anomala UBC 951]